MSPSEAFAAIALVAVACDGRLDHEEARSLRQQLEGRTPFRDRSEQEMALLFDSLLGLLRSEGWQTLLERAVPSLLPHQQETALAMAAHLVHSDRVIDPMERRLLELMAELVELPAERSERILEVISLLHRDSLAA
jgi:tellurite resistance protein